MDDRRAQWRAPAERRRSLAVARWYASLLSFLAITAVFGQENVASGPVELALSSQNTPFQRHFELEAGDASLMLNEFSRQSDLQVLFDFNILRGMKTRSVNGTMEPAAALRAMLQGTGLVFDFVNDRTLAVTPKKPGFFERLWHRISHRKGRKGSTDEADLITIYAGFDRGEPPPLGASIQTLHRVDIERSGASTVGELLRTLPGLFGGGANVNTVLGREAMSNTAVGIGPNYRGLGSGATLVLINGRPIAPSGDLAGFADVSNIPLSAIDHIDVVSEGGSTLYGAQAIGGTINFVMRAESGIETQIRGGFAAGGGLGERQVSQTLGDYSGEASGFLALEYDHRNALPASDRALATSDLQPWGGTNFDTPFGNPGTILTGAQTWAIPHGQNGSNLTPSAFTPGTQNLYDRNLGATITPEQQRLNLYATGSVPVAEDVQLFGDALVGSRHVTQFATAAPQTLSVPSTNAFYVNPASPGSNAPVDVEYGFFRDLGPSRLSANVRTGNFALGLTRVDANGWNLTGYLGYTFESQQVDIGGLVNGAALDAALADPNPKTAFNPFGDGSFTNRATLAAIQTQGHFSLYSALWSGHAAADRRLLSLPGGDLKLSIGVDARRQILDTSTGSVGAPAVATQQSRNSIAAFAELRLPLVGDRNGLIGLRHLDLSLGGRIERYTDMGALGSPTITLFWSPVQSLTFRATGAHLFKAPNLADLSEVTTGSEILTLPDTHSATGFTNALVAFGGNSTLRPETAHSWSFGVELHPPSIPDLSIALTHFDVDVHSEMDSISLQSNVLSDTAYSSFVVRNPTLAERTAVCDRGIFYGDAASCRTALIGAIVDSRIRNMSSVRTYGEDLAAKYSLQSRWGVFDFKFDGTHIDRFAESFTPGSTVQSLVNTQHNPLSTRLRGSIGHSLEGISCTLAVNYAGAYQDNGSTPAREVSSWTTVDAQLNYEFGLHTMGPLTGLRVTLSIRNLFNAGPPFLNSPLQGYDPENADLTGRFANVAVRKRW
jgi:iron complex outermembrane receptor protein